MGTSVFLTSMSVLSTATVSLSMFIAEMSSPKGTGMFGRVRFFWMIWMILCSPNFVVVFLIFMFACAFVVLIV